MSPQLFILSSIWMTLGAYYLAIFLGSANLHVNVDYSSVSGYARMRASSQKGRPKVQIGSYGIVMHDGGRFWLPLKQKDAAGQKTHLLCHNCMVYP